MNQSSGGVCLSEMCRCSFPAVERRERGRELDEKREEMRGEIGVLGFPTVDHRVRGGGGEP